MEQELLKLILVEIREMKGDISELKNSVKSIDTRLTNVENDITEVKKDVSKMKTDMTKMQADMTEMQADMTEMKEDISENTKDIKCLKEMSEFHTENINAIKNVVTSHYMEFKKFVNLNNTQHNLYDARLLQFNKDNK